MACTRLARLVYRIMRASVRRPPDVIIGGADNPYLRRWYIIPHNRLCNIYLHEFIRSDDDRALHDHPWSSLSFILHGSYLEHVADHDVPLLREVGDVSCRRATAAHRVELINRTPSWSLFLTGPRVRVWGFHCPKGWVDWRLFTNPSDGGATVGRGCD